MDEEGIPGIGTYSVPGFGGDMPPMRESEAPPSSMSQVPGTSVNDDGEDTTISIADLRDHGFGYLRESQEDRARALALILIHQYWHSYRTKAQQHVDMIGA